MWILLGLTFSSEARGRGVRRDRYGGRPVVGQTTRDEAIWWEGRRTALMDPRFATSSGSISVSGRGYGGLMTPHHIFTVLEKEAHGTEREKFLILGNMRYVA